MLSSFNSISHLSPALPEHRSRLPPRVPITPHPNLRFDKSEERLSKRMMPLADPNEEQTRGHLCYRWLGMVSKRCKRPFESLPQDDDKSSATGIDGLVDGFVESLFSSAAVKSVALQTQWLPGKLYDVTRRGCRGIGVSSRAQSPLLSKGDSGHEVTRQSVCVGGGGRETIVRAKGNKQEIGFIFCRRHQHHDRRSNNSRQN